MENNNVSNTDRLKSALCYIPLWWAIMYFVEVKKSVYLMKHIKYWSFLFIGFIILRVVFSSLFLPLGWLLFIIYLLLAVYFWMKAYNWEDFNIEVIDNMYPDNKNWAQNTVSSNNSATNNSQNTTQKEEFDENGNTNESFIKTDNIVVNKIANGISNVVKNVKKDNNDEFAEDNNDTKKDDSWKKEDILDF